MTGRRVRARVVSVEDGFARILPEGVDSVQGTLLLRPGTQIPHRLAVPGQEGWLTYRSGHNFGLHFFTEEEPSA